ncbi:hypothetical protein RF11_03030 [Thelohanellus kitauei]|uniref:Uncharacterized protein n=1 Tax=Thelohanellus kitauei TaxID=669202 RepID=A0A0C2MXC1_THEKT|nr:hypothetical protein RF11_03030 [Thelohanellus kitauei]
MAFLASIGFGDGDISALQSSHDLTCSLFFCDFAFIPVDFLTINANPNLSYAELVFRIVHPVGVSSDVHTLILEEISARLNDGMEEKKCARFPSDSEILEVALRERKWDFRAEMVFAVTSKLSFTTKGNIDYESPIIKQTNFWKGSSESPRTNTLFGTKSVFYQAVGSSTANQRKELCLFVTLIRDCARGKLLLQSLPIIAEISFKMSTERTKEHLVTFCSSLYKTVDIVSFSHRMRTCVSQVWI